MTVTIIIIYSFCSGCRVRHKHHPCANRRILYCLFRIPSLHCMIMFLLRELSRKTISIQTDCNYYFTAFYLIDFHEVHKSLYNTLVTNGPVMATAFDRHKMDTNPTCTTGREVGIKGLNSYCWSWSKPRGRYIHWRQQTTRFP